jgi:hypothetical protein
VEHQDTLFCGKGTENMYSTQKQFITSIDCNYSTFTTIIYMPNHVKFNVVEYILFQIELCSVKVKEIARKVEIIHCNQNQIHIRTNKYQVMKINIEKPCIIQILSLCNH